MGHRSASKSANYDNHWAVLENPRFSEDLKSSLRESNHQLKSRLVNTVRYAFNPYQHYFELKRNHLLSISVSLLTADEEIRKEKPHPKLYPLLIEIINTPRAGYGYSGKGYKDLDRKFDNIHLDDIHLTLSELEYFKSSERYQEELSPGEIVKQEDISRLLGILQDPTNEIYGNEKKFLPKDHWLRHSTAVTIGELEIDNPEINQVLIDILENPDEDDLLRYYSAWAIGKIQPEDPEVHQALTDALEELNAPLHTAVSWAIKQLEP